MRVSLPFPDRCKDTKVEYFEDVPTRRILAHLQSWKRKNRDAEIGLGEIQNMHWKAGMGLMTSSAECREILADIWELINMKNVLYRARIRPRMEEDLINEVFWRNFLNQRKIFSDKKLAKKR